MIGEQSSHTNQQIVRIPLRVARDKNEVPKIVDGKLTFPPNNNAKGIVIFIHGSGSSLQSQRNQFVARMLNKDGLVTLMVSLLTKGEEDTDATAQKMGNNIPGLVLNKFNIDLLSSRLLDVTDWVLENKEVNNLTIGYFGASTGAAAALIADIKRPNIVAAIVSRGGRPDLIAPENLSRVKSPTLLIVGGMDKRVVDINNKAMHLLTNLQKKKIVVIPGATHLFEEPGALEEVARLASGWFRCYFQLKEHEK
jgi:dienelactone hydrolase